MPDKKIQPNDSATQVETALTQELQTDAPESFVKRVDRETVTIHDIPYKLIENYREAFDVEELERRYSSFLERYDYIVADISDEKARLKGFYRADYKKAPIDLRISNLEDYLLEYCNFGCAYYVLQRADGKKATVPDNQRSRRGRKPSNRRYKGKSRRRPSDQEKTHERSSSRRRSENKPPVFETKERKRPESSPKTDDSKRVKTVKDNKGKTRFHIRKKDAGEG